MSGTVTAFNKATESNTTYLDKELAILALEFARSSNSKDLVSHIKDVLYYETDEEKRKKYIDEIAEQESKD